MCNYKYYDDYLMSEGLLWTPEPAKYIKKFLIEFGSSIEQKKVLDIGAGEGKNSIPFALTGCNVTAIDTSPIALSRFHYQPGYNKCKHNIEIINKSIFDINFTDNSFDIIIAYGLFHCFENSIEIIDLIKKIRLWLSNEGYFIGATFTNKLLPPEEQNYLNYNAFLNPLEFKELFKSWQILEYEEDIIREKHPIKGSVFHKHSIARIIARKI